MNNRKYLFLNSLKYSNANTKFICIFEYKNYLSQTLYLDLKEEKLQIRLCKRNFISFGTLNNSIYKIKNNKLVFNQGYSVTSIMLYNVQIDKIIHLKNGINFDFVKNFFLENFLEFSDLLCIVKKQFLYFVILIIYYTFENELKKDFYNFVKNFNIPELCL